MNDYWSDLNLVQKWSKRERFNYILTYLHSNLDSGKPKEENKPEEPAVVKKGNISVHVTDTENEAIQGAVVVLSDNTNEYTCTTGKAGGCSMNDVPVGNYECTTEAEEYITSVDDYVVVEGDNTLNIELDLDTLEAGSGEGMDFGDGPEL